MTIVSLLTAFMMQAASIPAAQPRTNAPLPGRRQTREDTAPTIAPMNRLSIRMETRIDARIQSRISHEQPDGTAAYQAAADQRTGQR